MILPEPFSDAARAELERVVGQTGKLFFFFFLSLLGHAKGECLSLYESSSFLQPYCL